MSGDAAAGSSDPFVTAGELAGLWRVSVYTVRRYLLAGKIKGAFRLAGSWRIPREVVKQGLGAEAAEAAEIARLLHAAR